MSHRNARLTVHGRRLLVHRVRELGMPVAHVAKAMGISRQCAHRWVARFDAEGDAGLHDRSSRPHSMPTRTPDEIEARIVAARLEHRRGQDWLGRRARRPGAHGQSGPAPPRPAPLVHARPADRRADPLLEDDRSPLRTRTTRRTGPHGRQEDRPDPRRRRLACPRPPDGPTNRNGRKARIGYDYVHSVVDDHTRLAYSEILDDERADTCAAFFARALDYFAAHGITRDRTADDRQRLELPPRHDSSASCSPSTASHTSSSSRTAPGRTAKSNASTAPSPPSGPTGRSSPATTNAPPPCQTSSTTTTTGDATPPSAVNHPSAACHQPDGRVHLVAGDGPSCIRIVTRSGVTSIFGRTCDSSKRISLGSQLGRPVALPPPRSGLPTPHPTVCVVVGVSGSVCHRSGANVGSRADESLNRPVIITPNRTAIRARMNAPNSRRLRHDSKPTKLSFLGDQEHLTPR